MRVRKRFRNSKCWKDYRSGRSSNTKPSCNKTDIIIIIIIIVIIIKEYYLSAVRTVRRKLLEHFREITIMTVTHENLNIGKFLGIAC